MFLRLHRFWGQEVGERVAVCSRVGEGFSVLTDDLYIDWHARALNAPVVALSAINDHAEHARRRRTWTRGFSPAVLKDYVEIVNKRTVQLTETLFARKSVDLARVFGHFS